ncbi:MAG: hypothetical protein NTX50_16460 [Candidatus Sumerlaeota bacterium]|nr:hypothetical protein [Candidatus Sumerlaeota bacterium]
MTELLLNERLVLAAFVLAAVVMPLIGAAIWIAAQRHSDPRGRRRAAVAIAISGPALGLLWLIYNGIIKVFDLDSLAGLGANFLIFTLAGLAAGLVWRRYATRQERQ